MATFIFVFSTVQLIKGIDDDGLSLYLNIFTLYYSFYIEGVIN
jgi:hypothetical protein